MQDSHENANLRADVIVIGSGPGGAITAFELARTGLSVILLEEGRFLPPNSHEPFSLQEMQRKYRNQGMTVALGKPPLAYVEGKCVGGGSEVNGGLWHRTPADVLARWSKTFGVSALSEESLGRHFEYCEDKLSVCRPKTDSPASAKLAHAAGNLGWKSLRVPRAYKQTENSATISDTGPKQTMTRTFIPWALERGCRLISGVRVSRLRRNAGRWFVLAESCSDRGNRQTLAVSAPSVFICCGAIQTPALLRRSGFNHHVGTAFKVHPASKVVACFDDEVNLGGHDIPFHQVTEFVPRFRIGCSASTVPHLSVSSTDRTFPGKIVEHWRQMAMFYAMTRGGTGKIVTVPMLRDPVVTYTLTKTDLEEIKTATFSLAQCLFESGARTIYPAVRGCPAISSIDQLHRIWRDVNFSRANLMSVHLFSSCPMGEKFDLTAVSSFGKVHGTDGLFVNDASILCDAPSVNPQGTIMAVAHRNALHFLGEL